MKDAYLMTGVQCHKCGMIANLANPAIFPSKQLMISAAREVHKQSKIICPEPLFVIGYQSVLVSNALVFTPPTTVNVEKNGKPAPTGQDTTAEIARDPSKELDIDPNSALGKILAKGQRPNG